MSSFFIHFKKTNHNPSFSFIQKDMKEYNKQMGGSQFQNIISSESGKPIICLPSWVIQVVFKLPSFNDQDLYQLNMELHPHIVEI